MTTFEKPCVRERKVNANFALGNAKLTQTFLYINSALFTFKTPIFEYKIRARERAEASDRAKKEKH